MVKAATETGPPRPGSADAAPRPVPSWGSVTLVVATVVGAILRVWDLSDPSSLFPDETYSAVTSSLPWTDIWNHVRSTDPHPPLSYLLLKPVEALTTDEAWLRLPSALCAVAALVVFAWWHRRSLEGILAVALFALSPLAIFYGHQVRMYGLMQLVGVVGAFAAARWWSMPGRRWAAIAAVAGLVGALSHATGFLLPVGLLLVPGLRRDRAANEWRIAQAISLALYAVLWGSAALSWRDASLYAPVTLSSWSITVNELVAPIPDNRIIVLPLLIAGAVVMVGRRNPDDRAWMAVVLAPIAIASVMALRTPVFIPKTFVFASWGIPMAFAAVSAALWKWRAPIGIVVAALGVLVYAAPIPHTFEAIQDSEPLAAQLDALVADGDVVVSHPPGDMVPWYMGTARPSSPGPGLGWPDTYEVKIGTAPWTGRVWLVDALYLGAPLPIDAPECAPTVRPSNSWQIRCLDVGAPR